MMSTHTGRLIHLVVALAVAVVLAAPGAVAAQEWKIYLHGKVEPIVANYYAEEAPWIFYRDDQSMYVFALGCDRIQRVERGGTSLPPPRCPVDRLPTTMPRVLVSIMDLEAKRLDDAVTRLREQTTAYARAVVGAFAVTGELFGERGVSPAESELARQRASDAVAFLRSQINDTLFEIRVIEQRVSALQDAAKGYPPRDRQRYFFAPR